MSRNAPIPSTNVLTPSYSTVASTNGFSSGDLVYYKDSNFGVVPSNAITTGTFNIAAAANIALQTEEQSQKIANFGGSAGEISSGQRTNYAAKLSNGNMVLVGAGNGDGKAYFKIFNPDGVVVTNWTQASTSGSSVYNNSVSVCALSGGGFVVGFTNGMASPYYFTYTVFDNTGAVVAAEQYDTSLSGTNSYANGMVGLANGGFIAAKQTAAVVKTRVYSSTGTQGTTTSQSTYSSDSVPIVAALSDSTFYVLCAGTSGTSYLSLYRYTAAGAFVSVYNAAAGDGYYGYSYSMCALTNDTLAIAYTESSSGIYYIQGRTFTPSTGAFSNAAYLFNSAQYCLGVDLKSLSDGNYVAVGSSTGANQGRSMVQKLSPTNTSVSIVLTAALPCYMQASNNGFTILEGASYITVFANNQGANSVVSLTQFSLSPFGTQRAFNTQTSVLGTASAAVNGYARSASTPNLANFLAATTQTLTISQAQSSGTTLTLTPYPAIGDSINWQSMCLTSDGKFVIAYTANGTAKFSVFNRDGTIFNTTTIGSCYNASTSLIRCICLGNGKLVFAVSASNTNISLYVYSSTYSLITSGNLSTISGLSYSSASGAQYDSRGFDIGTISDNGFIFAYSYNGSTNPIVSLTDALAMVNQNTFSGNPYYIRVASNKSGEISVAFYDAGGNYDYYYWYKKSTSDNTFAYTTAATLPSASSGSGYYNQTAVMLPSGTVTQTVQSSTTIYLNTNYAGSSRSVNTGLNCANTQCNATVAVTNSGASAYFYNNGSGASYLYLYSQQVTVPFGGSSANSPYVGIAITTPNSNPNGYPGANPCLVNLYDNTFAFSYKNTSNGINVGLVNIAASSYQTSITAGVTPTSLGFLPSPSNGYYLAGVAASDCAANGTGVLQINGAATLNSQYSASTTSQAFDFNSPTLSVGVRGTISGRNVLIKGS